MTADVLQFRGRVAEPPLPPPTASPCAASIPLNADPAFIADLIAVGLRKLGERPAPEGQLAAARFILSNAFYLLTSVGGARAAAECTNDAWNNTIMWPPRQGSGPEVA